MPHRFPILTFCLTLAGAPLGAYNQGSYLLVELTPTDGATATIGRIPVTIAPGEVSDSTTASTKQAFNKSFQADSNAFSLDESAPSLFDPAAAGGHSAFSTEPIEWFPDPVAIPVTIPDSASPESDR